MLRSVCCLVSAHVNKNMLKPYTFRQGLNPYLHGNFVRCHGWPCSLPGVDYGCNCRWRRAAMAGSVCAVLFRITSKSSEFCASCKLRKSSAAKLGDAEAAWTRPPVKRLRSRFGTGAPLQLRRNPIPFAHQARHGAGPSETTTVTPGLSCPQRANPKTSPQRARTPADLRHSGLGASSRASRMVPWGRRRGRVLPPTLAGHWAHSLARVCASLPNRLLRATVADDLRQVSKQRHKSTTTRQVVDVRPRSVAQMPTTTTRTIARPPPTAREPTSATITLE